MIAIGVACDAALHQADARASAGGEVEDYVEAARAVGNSHLRIALRTCCPTCCRRSSFRERWRSRLR
jgi:hypothetical protein